MSVTVFGWSLPFGRPRDLVSQVDGRRCSGSRAGAGSEAVESCDLAWAPTQSWVVRLAKVARRGRILVLTVTHALAFALIYLLAYVVQFDGNVPLRYLQIATATLPAVVAIKLTVFFGSGSHRGWWRYATFADMSQLAETATLGSLALPVGLWLGGFHVPRSVLLIDWAGTILGLWGTRGTARLLRERYYPILSTRRPKRVLVIGASEVGVALVGEIDHLPRLGMRVVGFLDSDRSTHGRVLGGVKILGSPEDVLLHVARQRVEIVLIPTPVVSSREINDLVTACSAVGVKVQVVPGVDALLSGTLKVEPRDVDIQDLLCRNPVRLDSRSVERFLRGRVVLITGAAGSIGSEMCRQVLAYRPERLVLLDHSENGLFYIERELRALASGTEVVACVASVTDGHRLRTLLTRHRPDVVFHAAAHKHVPMMEANPGEAVKNNVFGTRTLVDESIRAGVRAFVLISTDKAVNPTSVMGTTKRLAEMYVQAVATHQAETRLVTVRFGNVLGSNGSVVSLFRQQIRDGGPVTVTHPEMTRYFMTIPEASQLVLQAGAQGRGGEIFVLDMGQPIRVLDLARDMIRLSGLAEGREIEIVFTGCRPGEKLHEELHNRDEEQVPTPHPQIFAVKRQACGVDWLRVEFDHLTRTVNGPAEEVVLALSRLVPDYHPERAVCQELMITHAEAPRVEFVAL